MRFGCPANKPSRVAPWAFPPVCQPSTILSLRFIFARSNTIMFRKSVLELSSRWKMRRLPRKFTAPRYFSTSSRKEFSAASGRNGIPGPDPVGKPDGSEVKSSTAVVGAVIAGAFLVAYQGGYLDQYLGKGRQTTDETTKSDVITEKTEEAHHLEVALGTEESTQQSPSVENKVETQPEVLHSKALGEMQSEKEVNIKSDLAPEQSAFPSSKPDETPQESTTDTGEKSLPQSLDGSSTTYEDLSRNSQPSSDINFEPESVKLEPAPKLVDNTIVSAQASSGGEEFVSRSGPPKDHTTKEAPKDAMELDVERPASLLEEYHLRGNDSWNTRAPTNREHMIKENEALVNPIEELKDGYMTKDGKLVLDFLAAIHAAEKTQAELDSKIFAQELRAVKERYENKLRDLRARELMRIEEAALLDKELKRERTKAAAAIKAIQEKMEDMLRTEIRQNETEAQLTLEKVQDLAKAELGSTIAKEKAAQIEKMAEADLNIKALCMAFYARSEEAHKSYSVHKLALGAVALEDALSKGLPIQTEIDMLQTYLEGIRKESILDLVLSSLPEETRSRGTDTLLQLNQKFNTLKGTLRHFCLIPPSGVGILAHSLARIASWLKFKDVDQSGEGIESVIKRVDNYLAEGKVAEAAATLEEGVRGSQAEEIVGDWVRLARNRAITEQALTLLQSYATCVSLT